jgi:hypothetical protein
VPYLRGNDHQFPQRLFAFVGLTDITGLFLQTQSGSLVVVTNIDVNNRSGAEGSFFDIYLPLGASGAIIHQAERGAGAHDSFPWRGQFVLGFEESLTFESDGGSEWDVTGSGFFVPDVSIVMP